MLGVSGAVGAVLCSDRRTGQHIWRKPPPRPSSDVMAFSLSPMALQNGFRLEAHDTVGSTNAVALERAQAGDPGKLWMVSKQQESGRGRRGRAWATPHGQSCCVPAAGRELRTEDAATLGFVAGSGAGRRFGCCRAEPAHQQLDLMAAAASVEISVRTQMAERCFGRRRKARRHFARIDAACRTTGSALVIGIGVNVVAYPDDVPYPATSLSALGADCDAETLFLALSDAWSRTGAIWSEGRGLPRSANAGSRAQPGSASEVAVRVDGNVLRGVFETIDEDCRFCHSRQ